MYQNTLKLHYYFAIIFAGIIISCEKDIQKQDEVATSENALQQLTIDNNMLFFTDYSDFEQTTKMLSTMSEQELDTWEREIGFTSLRTEKNIVYDMLDCA